MNRNWVWSSKPWQAFKTFAILFSFIMNFILLLVMLFVLPLLLPILNDIVKPIVGGLDESFNEMSSANISQSIPVRDTMPISFTLPLEATTDVFIVESVPLNIPARFMLPGGGGEIIGSVILALPAGLKLPIKLELAVPVDQEIDVALDVEVEIPLAETELGVPFVRLQNLFGPLNQLIEGLPDDSQELFERIAGREDEAADTAVSSSSE